MGVPAYINVDTQDPDRVTPFWCDLLDVKVQTTRDEGRYVVLAPSPRLPGSMMLVFQRVPAPKTAKNRVHVDVIVDDLEEGTKRVEELGGRWTEPGRTLEIDGFHWRVMADPEGKSAIEASGVGRRFGPSGCRAAVRCEASAAVL